MNTSLTGNVIAGLVAAVIYVVIAAATGAGFWSAVGVGLLIAIVVFAIAYGFSRWYTART